jgi:hypothetical protein
MLTNKLSWIDAPTADPYMAMYVSDDILLGDYAVSDYPWLAQLAHRAPDAPDLPLVMAQHAIFTWVRGDVQGALAELAAAKQKAPPDEQETARELDRLAATVRLHTATAPITTPIPSMPEIELGNAQLIEMRDGHVPADARLVSLGDADQLRAALEAATRGDGGPLAHHLESDAVFDTDIRLVLAVVPLVTHHRAELAAALRGLRDPFWSRIESLPFAQLADAAMRRDLARLAGDEDSARHWQKLVDAQLPVIADRDKLTAFLLWHD